MTCTQGIEEIGRITRRISKHFVTLVTSFNSNRVKTVLPGPLPLTGVRWSLEKPLMKHGLKID